MVKITLMKYQLLIGQMVPKLSTLSLFHTDFMKTSPFTILMKIVKKKLVILL